MPVLRVRAHQTQHPKNAWALRAVRLFHDVQCKHKAHTASLSASRGGYCHISKPVCNHLDSTSTRPDFLLTNDASFLPKKIWISPPDAPWIDIHSPDDAHVRCIEIYQEKFASAYTTTLCSDSWSSCVVAHEGCATNLFLKILPEGLNSTPGIGSRFLVSALSVLTGLSTLLIIAILLSIRLRGCFRAHSCFR